MPETLHDRIRAKVADWRDNWQGTEDFNRRICDHADRILDRHQDRAGRCWSCSQVLLSGYRDGAKQPCPEVRDLAEAWGVEP